ncbi:hypothetical protein LCGC14_1939800 [marine sediment metagenome]|uniref:Uncharacterized protein n=1 Tax=marine sediment metagenome TaxID=412755 RepID=A0A0F9G940_9ZZZZ
MNRTTPLSSIYNGLFYDAVTPSLKLYRRGTLYATFTASKPAITGDTSAYVEGTITGIVDALEALGLVTDSTTT